MHIEEEEITGTAFTAAEYPTSVGATLSAASKKFFSFEKGISAECGKASVSGTLLKEVGQLSLSPSYAECVAFGYQGASMLMNGCQYLMHPGTETGEGTFAGTFDIDCPTGSSIVIKAATCEVSIPSQANAGTIEYANREAGEVEEKEVAAAIVLSGGSEHLKYTKAKDGFLCPLNGTGTKEDGALAINGALEGSSLIQITG
jgi:hypothetical protein